MPFCHFPPFNLLSGYIVLSLSHIEDWSQVLRSILTHPKWTLNEWVCIDLLGMPGGPNSILKEKTQNKHIIKITSKFGCVFGSRCLGLHCTKPSDRVGKIILFIAKCVTFIFYFILYNFDFCNIIITFHNFFYTECRAIF